MHLHGQIVESDSESDALVGTAAGSGSTTEQFSDSSTVAEAENVTTDSSTPPTSSVKSLLSSQLQQATSKLAQIRKVKCNPPTSKKCSATVRSIFAPATIQPMDCVKKYQEKQFIVSDSKFFVQHARRKYRSKECN